MDGRQSPPVERQTTATTKRRSKAKWETQRAQVKRALDAAIVETAMEIRRLEAYLAEQKQQQPKAGGE